MSETIVKFKRLAPDAVVPTKANPSDSGFDLIAINDGTIDEKGFIEYETGIAVQPPVGYYFELFPRSSISKYDLILANGIGVIDQGYTNSIKIRFKMPNRFSYQSQNNENKSVAFYPFANVYKKGDKIAQLILKKLEPVILVEVENLSETVRGTGGFGSSGN